MYFQDDFKGNVIQKNYQNLQEKNLGKIVF